MSRRVALEAVFLGFMLVLHVLPLVRSPALIGGDEPHYALMAHSLAMDGDIELANNYDDVAAGGQAAGSNNAGREIFRHLVERDGRLVFFHPLGLPLLAAPLIRLQQSLAPGAAPDLLLAGLTSGVTFVAMWAGWCALRRAWPSPPMANLALILIYFSTPLWFYSRTFFTEPYVWSLMVLAVSCMVFNRWTAAAVFLGLAFLIKETSLLLILPCLAHVWHRQGGARLARVATGPALAFLLFGAKNLLVHGRPVVTFVPFEAGSALAGAAGLLVDPARGLVWFAPILLLAGLGWFLGASEHAELRLAARYACLAVAAYFLLTATWIDWRGGKGFGPRLLVPVMPAFVLPLLQVLESRRRRLSSGVILAAGAMGFTVQWCAALAPVQAFRSISIDALLAGRAVTVSLGLILFTGGAALAVLWSRAARAHPASG